MRIQLLRRIDFWVGIPLCFLFSVFDAILRFLTRPGREANGYKKILFLEFSEIGSAILSRPAIQSVKRKYPDAELYFWVFRANRDGVRVLNVIPDDHMITMRAGNFFVLLADLCRNVARIRREKIDAVIDMELFSRFSALCAYLTGAPVRVGFNGFFQEGLYRGQLQTHRVVYNPYFHISVNFLALTEALACSPTEIPAVKKDFSSQSAPANLEKIRSSPERQSRIWDKLKAEDPTIRDKSKLVVIHPSVQEALPLRRWAFGNYLTVARGLLEDPNIRVIAAGSLSGPLAEDIAVKLSVPGIITLIGKTTIPELIDLFNISRLLISHDSGMIHIAALTDIQILALFGPETPALYAPLTPNKRIYYKNFSCSPCLTAFNQRCSPCTDNLCLQAISAEEVLEDARRLMR